MPGILAVKGPAFPQRGRRTRRVAHRERLLRRLRDQRCNARFPLIVVVDDSEFAATTLNNLIWMTFTRSNPAADIYGVGAFTQQQTLGLHRPAGDRRPDQAAPRAAIGRGPKSVKTRRCVGSPRRTVIQADMTFITAIAEPEA